MFKNNCYIHVYSPRTGADSPWGHFFMNSIIQSIEFFAASFPQLNDFITAFPIQTYRDRIKPSRKLGQGQPTVIIYIKFVELESPMIHAKFQDHRTSGSGVEDFLRFLPYMGMTLILVV